MRMYVIFHEKATHAHNYKIFLKELCFNNLISTL